MTDEPSYDRELRVPPGTYNLRHGEQRVVVNASGERIMFIADRGAVRYFRLAAKGRLFKKRRSERKKP